MPDGYTIKRRVGYVRNNASSNFDDSNIDSIAYSTMLRQKESTSYDFITSDFTTNGAWIDLDCSAIVPPNATSIEIRGYLTDNASASYISIRKNGDTTSDITTTLVSGSIVANISTCFSAKINCDTNQIIEYLGTNTTFTDIYFNIIAWTKPIGE
jgi:hypothetical protein